MRMCMRTYIGFIPQSLCGLPSLTVLYLNNNELTGKVVFLTYTLYVKAHIPLSTRFTVGSIPANIGKLTGLTILSLKENKLTG